RDGAHMVISSFGPDGPPGSRTVQIFVEDVVALREELMKAGVTSVSDIVDQEWGNLEMGVSDPDGNKIGFSQVKTAHVTLLHDAAHPSALELSIVEP
ncbi:MAG TPA: VOC family protein, partial [Thermoanaerobaculia bacterium]|nr:VOC family protein [Thermoanaerobaculia bacterium]